AVILRLARPGVRPNPDGIEAGPPGARSAALQLEDPEPGPGKVPEGRAELADPGPAPWVVPAIQAGLGPHRQRPTDVPDVAAVLLEGPGHDLLPPGPVRSAHVERRVELDPGPERQRHGIVDPTGRLDRRAGDEVRSLIGDGEDQRVTDVALGDLLGPDDAAHLIEAAAQHRAAPLV